jgi:hypothetical protein
VYMAIITALLSVLAMVNVMIWQEQKDMSKGLSEMKGEMRATIPAFEKRLDNLEVRVYASERVSK